MNHQGRMVWRSSALCLLVYLFWWPEKSVDVLEMAIDSVSFWGFEPQRPIVRVGLISSL